jgi:hypothetical protein
VEHRQVEDRRAVSCGGSGDDPARFLRELRQLRDGAGLGPAELAARAHYPYDRIKAAEVGPTLPDLPVLSAYVRGCGGTTEEWEERWRSLTSAPTLPLVDARPAGSSTAASAGARIGSISPVADAPDPSIIQAALDRVAEQMAVGTSAPLPSRSGVSTIEPHPGIAPAAAKPAGGKAGTGWETTTMRTAWSTGPEPAAREAYQPLAGTGPTTAGTGPTTAAEAGTDAVKNVRAVPAHAGSAGPLARPTAGSPGSTSPGSTSPEPGVGWAGVSGGPSAIKPVVAAAAAATRAAAVGPAAVGPAGSGPAVVRPAVAGRRSRGARGSRALSRTTIVALIAVAFCVLVALLAIFA